MLRINRLLTNAKINKREGNIFSLPTFDDTVRRLYLKLEMTFVDSEYSNSVTCLCDTGSDVNIISKAFLARLFPRFRSNLHEQLDTTLNTVQGFSGGKVNIIGTVKIAVRTHVNLAFEDMIFYVCDIETNFPCIVGLRSLEILKLDMIFRPDPKNYPRYRPYLRHWNKQYQKYITSYHLSDADTSTCKLKVSLPPQSSKFFEVTLPNHLNFIQGDTILVADDFVENDLPEGVDIIATTSELQQNYHTRALSCMVQIVNGSDTRLDKELNLSFENIESDEPVKIDRHNINSLKLKSLFVPMKKGEIYMPTPDSDESCDGELYQSEEDVFPVDLDVNLTTLQYFPQNTFLLDTIFPTHNEFVAGDPNSYNNNCPDVNVSLTDGRANLPPFDECTPEIAAKFRDSNQAIQLGIQEYSDEAIEEEIHREGGISVPNNLHLPIEEFVKLDDYEEEVRPYIEELFIKKYPLLVSRHSLDLGNLSKTLGKYRLKLKKYAKLPKFRKIYYLNSSELQQLEVILQFLLRYQAISKIDVQGDNKDLHLDSFASPSYLIPRSNPNSSARLIVNYRHLNQLLEQEAVHIDTASSVINSYREAYLYSSVDLSCAFQSIRLTPDCEDLTLFSTPLGTFKSHILPTGVKCSPNTLSTIMCKAIHHRVCRDEEGSILYENGLPKMEYDPIEGVKNIYDDLIIGSPLKATYAETLAVHFALVDRVLERLNFHSGKLSFPKCSFAKTCINFFGVFLQHKFCCADPARIQKILDRNFPENLKAMRSILGVINSLCKLLGHCIQLDIGWLQELTKTKNKNYVPTEEHRQAFKRIKKALSDSCLYSCVIEPGADKVLFTDSAVGPRSCFSAVLAQIVKPNNEEGKVHIPAGLNLQDRNHRIIFDARRAFMPLPLLKKNQDLKDYRLTVKENGPPEYKYLDEPFFGWSEEDADSSLTKSLKTIYDYWNNTLDLKSICKKMSTNIRGTVWGPILKESLGSQINYEIYLKNLRRGIIGIDPNFTVFQVLSEALQREIHVISAYHIVGEDFRTFGEHVAQRGPLIFLIYPCKIRPRQTTDNTSESKLVNSCSVAKRILSLHAFQKDKSYFVARPAINPQTDSYRYDRFRGGFEVVSYLSKAMPEKHLDSHIYEMELQGILTALLQYRKLIGRANLLLLTDNKCLYYLFNESMLESSVKLSRWRKKLIIDYSNMTFGFVKSGDNISDFLSRRYEIEKPVVRRIQLPRFVKDSLDEAITQEVYTPNEWSNFVTENPQFLGEVQTPQDSIDSYYKVNIINHDMSPAPVLHVNNLKGRMAMTQKMLLSPITHLKNYISHENIVEDQRVEFKELYTKCLAEKTHSFTENKITYFLMNNLLFREVDLDAKILLPTKYVNHLVALGHLLCNHSGYKKVKKNLANFYHETLQERIKDLCAACFACQITNHPTKQQELGYYHTDDDVMSTLHMDLAEHLPTNEGYNHICIIVDPISDFVLTLPLKTKSTKEFLVGLVYLLQPFLPSVKRILCDGAGHFVSHTTLQMLQAYGVQVLYSAAYHSYGHGLAESHVKLFKTALTKVLSTQTNNNWLYALPLLTSQHNAAVSNKTSFAPREVLFGKSTPLSASPLSDLANFDSKHTHPKLRKKSEQVKVITDELTDIISQCKREINIERDRRITQRNKNRIKMEFAVNDIVLVKSHSKILGRPSALDPYFQFSPYRIKEIGNTTCVVVRLTDGLELTPSYKDIDFIREYKYPKGQLKVYKNLPERFQNLHPTILQMISKTMDDVNGADIKFLIEKDDFDIPPPYDIQELINKAERERQIGKSPQTSKDGQDVGGATNTVGSTERPTVSMDSADENSDSSTDDEVPGYASPIGNDKPSPYKLRRHPKKVRFDDYVTNPIRLLGRKKFMPEQRISYSRREGKCTYLTQNTY